MDGFVDIHHHLLYGLDDGPAAFHQMAGMLRAAHEDGIAAIIATPHAAPGFKLFDGALAERRVREARAYCRKNALPIKIYPGAEVLVTPKLFSAPLLSIPTLAGTRYVLVEFSPGAEYEEAERAVRALMHSGRVPVVAHAERCRFLTARPERLFRLKGIGALFQINCSALLDGGWLNLGWLIREGLIDFVATDAHDTAARECRMRSAHRILERIAGSGCARALTNGNAQARLFAQVAYAPPSAR
jgi:protein-tyrosine phosphatase